MTSRLNTYDTENNNYNGNTNHESDDNDTTTSNNVNPTSAPPFSLKLNPDVRSLGGRSNLPPLILQLQRKEIKGHH